VTCDCWVGLCLWKLKQVSKDILYADKHGCVRTERNATGQVMIHFDMNPGVWDKSSYKVMKEIWNDEVEKLYMLGIDEIFSLVPNESKVLKFQRMFGMKPLIEFKDVTLFRRYT
jgi:hypothetical protein